MCVIFFYVLSNPSPSGYKLILASNRDEFFVRATATATKWISADHVYGGIDLEPGREGGTWLAASDKNGIIKVGALLNLTGEPKPRNALAHYSTTNTTNNNNSNHDHHHHNNNNNKNIKCTSPTSVVTPNNEHFLLGRGMIVADYVSNCDNDHTIVNYNNHLLAHCTKYTAFNFVSIQINKNESKPAQIQLLSNVPPTLDAYKEGQCYGFGNSLPDAPFQKVKYGQLEFERIVEEYGIADPILLSTKLMDLLKNSMKHWPDHELERRAPNWGEGLSSLNVHIEEHGYGSRTHSVILVDSDGQLHFIEETMTSLDPAGEWQRTHIEKLIPL